MKITRKIKDVLSLTSRRKRSGLRRQFLTSEFGGTAISFLLMLPVILSFLALAMDGSRLLMKKNRLNRVLNESALAVSANRLADKLEITDEDEKAAINKTLLKDFIVAHFPDDELKSYDVSSSVETITSDSGESTVTHYVLTARIKVNTLLPLDGLPSFPTEIEISNGGRVKLSTASGSVPTDFAFVLDFSTSMKTSIDLGNGNTITRIDLLKQVMADIMPTALNANENNKVTLVPYAIGVAEKLSGTNPAGGERVGCTVLNVTTDDSYNVDHSFWNRMAVYSDDTYSPPENLWGGTFPTVTFKAAGDYSKAIVKLDYFRYEYYRNYVAVATGYSFDEMVSLGWCTDNQGTEYGKIVPYSCAQDYEIKLTSQDGQKIVANEYDNFLNNQLTYPNFSMMMENADISYMLEHLFDDDSDSLVTFEMEWVPAKSSTAPPSDMNSYCALAGLSNQRYTLLKNMPKLMSKTDIDTYTKKYFPNVELAAYMINLTNELDELNEIQDMTPYGQTDSNTALLRAAQELQKGTNKRKVIIVISDGEDYPYFSLTEKMHETYSVCSRIREGLLANSTGTEEVLFYFIATVKDLDDTMDIWATYCTDIDLASGEGTHTMLATNYTTLSSALLAIVTEQSETGSFDVD